jgi:SAM-dependent methyltransferase
VAADQSFRESPGLLPSLDELKRRYLAKRGGLDRGGWSVARYYRFGYIPPDDYYEAVVSGLVGQGAHWLDVGSGRSPFPNHGRLARELADRCALMVGVDPSPNILENPFVHERAQAFIEDYRSERVFDVITLRMVAEHITDPPTVLRAFERLLAPGGHVVIYTPNRWSPVELVSSLVPFGLHHPIKRLFWDGDAKDTFPTAYKMNSRSRLRQLFTQAQFDEVFFRHLDDCATFSKFKVLNWVELQAWRFLTSFSGHYPENCLLGVYQKRRRQKNVPAGK